MSYEDPGPWLVEITWHLHRPGPWLVCWWHMYFSVISVSLFCCVRPLERDLSPGDGERDASPAREVQVRLMCLLSDVWYVTALLLLMMFPYCQALAPNLLDWIGVLGNPLNPFPGQGQNYILLKWYLTKKINIHLCMVVWDYFLIPLKSFGQKLNNEIWVGIRSAAKMQLGKSWKLITLLPCHRLPARRR